MRTSTVLRLSRLSAVLLFAAIPAFAQQDDATLTLKTSVRRVVVDVVVTDAQGNPVPGLTKQDFALAEDGRRQSILSFEANGFDHGMDYLPPKLPAEPLNTFVNLPATAEKGPLYVLLYDLVNMDNQDQMAQTVNEHLDQMRGRQQLVKFIQSKPEGSRFAIFVWSDGLHLVQGFTSDKAQLYATVDPSANRPHMPKIFLMGENSGRADVHATLAVFNQIAGYLDGMRGRKNLIWFSGTFPLSLYPSKDDGPDYIGQSKATLDLLARNQIAIYPVDVRGVVSADWHSSNGIENEAPIVSARNVGDPNAAAANASTNQSSAAKTAHGGNGQSLLASSYSTMDEIARETGGRAFYSTNDVSAALVAATEMGSNYYTLTYAPENTVYDGTLRSIQVELAKKGYRLAYRRSYYGTDTGSAPASLVAGATGNLSTSPDGKRGRNDTLDAYMKHGAPNAHQLIFAAHVRAVGTPAKGTPEQMAKLALQPAYSKARKGPAKPPAPVPLQRFAIDYTVMAHQLRLQESHLGLNLQLASAAYDSEGIMLNSVVDVASNEPAAAKESTESKKSFRAQQVMDVPLAATSLRVAVQDANSGRIGVMEIKLPLPPEDATQATAAP